MCVCVRGQWVGAYALRALAQCIGTIPARDRYTRARCKRAHVCVTGGRVCAACALARVSAEKRGRWGRGGGGGVARHCLSSRFGRCVPARGVCARAAAGGVSCDAARRTQRRVATGAARTAVRWRRARAWPDAARSRRARARSAPPSGTADIGADGTAMRAMYPSVYACQSISTHPNTRPATSYIHTYVACISTPIYPSFHL